MSNSKKNTSKHKYSKTSNRKSGKISTIIVISFIVCCIFPALFILFPIVIIIAVLSGKKADNYSADHKTNVKGSGKGVRNEILMHEKPIDYNKSTYDIYNELLNKKTDYSGVNKDLL